jgi:beta-aspartyl-peptidase (threonine type)
MNDDSDKGGGVVAVVLILFLLLLMGGGVAYFLVGRHQLALAQAEEARLAEAEARMQAERAHADAGDALRMAAVSRVKETSSGENNSIRAAVESILRDQEQAWNRGDIDAFVEHYWKSESLTFSSGGKTTRGWTETLDRYRQRYPTPEKMGRLTLGELEVTPLGDLAALVLGQWNLVRDSEPLSGNFSLVFRKLDGRWVIVHDHTSRLMD